jgi:GTP cyclohydrolase I
MIEQDKFKKVPHTPMKDNGLTPDQKKRRIEKHFKEIMETLGLDLSDDSLMDTPKRVAKMYVDEICKGLREDTFPKITTVKNKFGSQMVTEANITMNSLCEHHFVTICGFAHISYIPKKDGKVIGLSKMNRLVEYWGSRPQVQERLTEQIQKSMCELLDTDDVAVVVDGVHFCVRSRGIKDSSSVTRTSALSGKYLDDPKVREEFFNSIPSIRDFKL